MGVSLGNRVKYIYIYKYMAHNANVNKLIGVIIRTHKCVLIYGC